MQLYTGLYEQIINQLFEEKLKQEDIGRYYIGKKPIDKSNVASYLSQYLNTLFRQVLMQLPDDETGVDIGVRLTNQIIKKLGRNFNLDSNNLIDKQKEILTAVVDKTRCEYPDIAKHLEKITPVTSLSRCTLFTGSGYRMESELQREIASADEVWMLVSFIKTSGLALLLPQLKELTNSGRRLRVVTTTYMHNSDFKAIKQLASLQNSEIKISYNSDVDRLHAKSYIFFRNSGFNTAYVGSSNLSSAAITSGLEWNLKITQIELPEIMATIKGTFESYWQSDGFETFVPGRDDERLKNALDATYVPPIDYSVLDLIKAKDYQEEVLEQLRIERDVHHHYRNLIVAATGTGKTVIAAFDYKRFVNTHKRANFLFVAHREEILKQSIQTFRRVLGDYNFGELWYSGCVPEKYDHVFASKDILNNRLDEIQLPDDYFDYIIIDEVHHVAANSYRIIISKFKPKILIGLTATPERMDGDDITADFDGHISAEIRLDKALNNRLLSPFHYYGITDSVDLTTVRWDHGHYVASELSKIYTINDTRTGIIFNALQKYLDNYTKVKALCFCVDMKHAEYMAAKFTLAGLKAGKLTSDNAGERVRLSRMLQDGKINYLFVVDMFNEGVDIPDIDTILFLRPTESLTIFLQQLGRGLRKAPGKDYVTVLDFVGQCNGEFNYTDRFRALIGKSSMSVREELESGFPHLPFGCQITLEPKAREVIIGNIVNAIRSFSQRSLVMLAKNWHLKFTLPLNLSNFLKTYNVPLEKLYRNTTFADICLQAGVSNRTMVHNNLLSKAVHNKWLSTDSFSYFSFIKDLASKRFCQNVNQMKPEERKLLLMFYYDVYQAAGKVADLQTMLDQLATDEVFAEELCQIMDILKLRCKTLEQADNSGIVNFPLKLHAVYTRDQIRVALGTSTLQKQSSVREGVERNRSMNVEAMYVDIIKNRQIGDSTNYDDHALSRNIFQWDTQNKVSPDSPTGQAYINSSQTMLLFVREQKNFADDKSRTMGYVYLGRAELLSYEYKAVAYGRQMQIKWKMMTDMPASVYEFAKYKSAM